MTPLHRNMGLRLYRSIYSAPHSLPRETQYVSTANDCFNDFGKYMTSSKGGSLSSVPNGRIIDFEEAELRRLPFQDSLYLWVKGSAPGIGQDVKLAPRVYRERPDYWIIEVTIITVPHPVNDLDEGKNARDFERSIPLTGVTGHKGIMVIGANQVKQIDISGESE